MNQQSKDLGIRPLGIGELADKSITLFVKHIVPFALVWLACTIPGMLFSAWGLSSGAAAAPILIALGTLLSLLGAAVGGLATSAIVGKIYAGDEPQWGWALRRGASKILSVIVLGFLMGLIAIIPVLILWFVTAGIFASLVSSSPAIAVLAAAIPALALMILAAVLYLVQYIALNAIVIENLGANDALTKGFRYMFHEGRFWPNVALGFCLLLVVYGGGFVSGLAGGFVMVKANPAIGQGLETILTAVVGAVGAIVAAVFFFDMRMRYDGYDIERSLDALEQPAGAGF